MPDVSPPGSSPVLWLRLCLQTFQPHSHLCGLSLPVCPSGLDSLGSSPLSPNLPHPCLHHLSQAAPSLSESPPFSCQMPSEPVLDPATSHHPHGYTLARPSLSPTWMSICKKIQTSSSPDFSKPCIITQSPAWPRKPCLPSSPPLAHLICLACLPAAVQTLPACLTSQPLRGLCPLPGCPLQGSMAPAHETCPHYPRQSSTNFLFLPLVLCPLRT